MLQLLHIFWSYVVIQMIFNDPMISTSVVRYEKSLSPLCHPHSWDSMRIRVTPTCLQERRREMGLLHKQPKSFFRNSTYRNMLGVVQIAYITKQEITSSLQLCSSDVGATHRPFSSLPNDFSVCGFREVESVGMAKVVLGRSSQLSWVDSTLCICISEFWVPSTGYWCMPEFV